MAYSSDESPNTATPVDDLSMSDSDIGEVTLANLNTREDLINALIGASDFEIAPESRQSLMHKKETLLPAICKVEVLG